MPMNNQADRPPPAKNFSAAPSPFNGTHPIGDATELALASAQTLLTRLPEETRKRSDGSERAYAVTMFVTELNDDPAQIHPTSPEQMFVLQGVWHDGQFDLLDGVDQHVQLPREQRLLGPTLVELEEQRRKLARQRRVSRHLLTAAATLVFLLCGSGVVALSAWVTRDRAIELAVQKKRDEMQREADRRLAAAASAAASREATITQALRDEAELRGQTEQQVQAIEAQRRLDNLGRDALAMILKNEHDAANRRLDRALDLLHVNGDRKGRALLLVSAGAAFSQKKNYAAAERRLRQAIDELAVPQADPSLTVEANTHLAAVCRAQHRDEDALKYWRNVLRLRERLWGGTDMRLIPILQDMALTAFDLHQFELVESICVRIQAIRSGEDRAASPEAVHDLSLLALAQVRQGKFDDAAAVCKRILLIEPAFESDQKQRLKGALTQLSHLYVEKGRHSQGMILLERAMRISGGANDLSPRETSDWRMLARLYVRERRYKQAEPIYKRLIETRETSAGSDDPLIADDASELAELYERQERFGEAEALYKLAITIREKVLGPYHLDVAKSAVHLADLYRVQGQTAQAEALYELAREIRKQSVAEER